MKITDGMVNAAKRIRDTAMEQTMAARIPESGHFGAIAQDADWLVDHLSPAPVGVTDEMVLKFITTSRDEDAGYQNWTEAVTAGLNAALASHEPAPTDTQEGVEWQPIETAPKGSEMFLAYAPPSNDFPDGRTIIVKGSILASMMAEGAPNHLAFPATLWMPLPVPSATGEQQ